MTVHWQLTCIRPVPMAFIGDSNTVGHWTATGWRMKQPTASVSMLRELVAADFDIISIGERCTPTARNNRHSGYSGESTEDCATALVARMAQWQGLPEVLTLALGTNDIVYGRTNEQIKAGLDSILDLVWARYASAKVLLQNMCHLFFPAWVTPALSCNAVVYPAIIAERTAAGKTIALVDAWNAATELSDFDEDEVHPNETGNSKIAAVYATALRSIL